MKKLIIVFSGPSGAGKSTLTEYLLERLDSIGLTVSHTTRLPRESELDGCHYHFVKEAKFKDMIANDEFVEYTMCYENYYGTSKESITRVLATKDICVLDLEYEGAYKMLMEEHINATKVGILVLPPSLSTLRRRLSERNTETAGSLKKRLNDAFTPQKIAKYTHVIINKDLNTSQQELLTHINNELLKARC